MYIVHTPRVFELWKISADFCHDISSKLKKFLPVQCTDLPNSPTQTLSFVCYKTGQNGYYCHGYLEIVILLKPLTLGRLSTRIPIEP